MSNSADIIDSSVIQGLVDLSGGDEQFLAELVETYLTESPVLLERLREAVHNSNSDAVRLNAHSLKGSSAEFGASYLVELCRQMEYVGRDRDLELAPELLGEIDQEYGRVAYALPRVLHLVD